MSDPLTHPGQLCAAGNRAVDLSLELGQARVRLARYEAQEARIRALCANTEGYGRLAQARYGWLRVEAVLAALDEPEAPT